MDDLEQNFLNSVLKPGRYIGRECNAVYKDKGSMAVHMALVFPEIYEIGMSALSIPILYHILNTLPQVWAERVFIPWVDALDILYKQNLPSNNFSLEPPVPVLINTILIKK